MNKWIFLTGLAFFFLGGCQKEPDLLPSDQVDALKTTPIILKNETDSQEVTLKIGDIAWIFPEGIGIAFTDVTEDSRCPEGVTCFWQGRAVAKLTVSKRGQIATVLIATPSSATDPPASLSVMGLSIYMRGMLPYPTAENPNIPKEDYRLTLLIKRGGNINGN